MQTKYYTKAISNYVGKFTYTNTYSFFAQYEEANGQPKNDLIFLKYSDFDHVIQYFFSQLIDFLRNNGNYHNIQLHHEFNSCVNDFFIYTTTKNGNLSQKIKDQYDAIRLLNQNEFNNLIDEIKNIKAYYVNKYITNLFNNIRNEFGAKLQKENEIFLCPYCERNYINVIQKNELTIKPDLDHFYPKAKYPFLAATIENLIPACQVCNSRLKKEIDFFKYKHLHPLYPTENIFRKIKFLHLGNKHIYIKSKHMLSDREKQYLETFRIEEIYNTHTEILDDLLEKNKRYNYVKKNHILKTCPTMGMKTIKELVFHEYINIDHNKVPMSSLKKSLFEKIVT